MKRRTSGWESALRGVALSAFVGLPAILQAPAATGAVTLVAFSKTVNLAAITSTTSLGVATNSFDMAGYLNNAYGAGNWMNAQFSASGTIVQKFADREYLSTNLPANFKQLQDLYDQVDKSIIITLGVLDLLTTSSYYFGATDSGLGYESIDGTYGGCYYTFLCTSLDGKALSSTGSFDSSPNDFNTFYYTASATILFTGEKVGIDPTLTLTGEYYSNTPEPGAWALSLLGFGVLGATLRRSRRNKNSSKVGPIAS